MPPWTKDNVEVRPAPIAGENRAAELLQRYYENSPTKLDIHRELTQAEKDMVAEANWYNRIACESDKGK